MAGEASPLRVWLLEWFALANLAFLALDVYLAHLANDFAHDAEWIPVAFSVVAPVVLFPGVIRRRHATGWARWAGLVVGGLSIAVGLVGLFYHLGSHFFVAQSLEALVYTAPFVAPLAYAGIGFLLWLNRLPLTSPSDWAPWVIFLAAAGWVGNFGLSLLDHAQNGFFFETEWIPVGAAAFAVGFLFTAVVRPEDRPLLWICLGVMAAEVLVGVGGAVLHTTASLADAGSLEERIVYGAPLFAPLLFADLALLAAIGIWDLLAAGAAEGRADQPVASGVGRTSATSATSAQVPSSTTNGK